MFDLGQIPPTEAAVIDNNAPRSVAPEPGITVTHGEYLVRSTCSACHGDSLNGGSVRGLDGELEIELNLSPGGELANWSEAEFMTALRSGVTPSGRVISETMPWQNVGQMTVEGNLYICLITVTFFVTIARRLMDIIGKYRLK